MPAVLKRATISVANFLSSGRPQAYVLDYNRSSARLQAGPLFLATVALLIPSMLAERAN